MSCTAAHLRSRSLNIVLLSDMIEGSYRSWNLYTTGQLVDGLQQKKKRFSLNGNGIMSSFLGRQFYRSTLYKAELNVLKYFDMCNIVACILWCNRSIQSMLLYIDLRPGQTCHSKDGGSVYSIGVGELGWQNETGLKSHGTVTNWCTGREWPVNCMTVISARWRSNMPFQRRRKCIFWWPVVGRYWVGVELLYNSVHRKFSEFGDQPSWRLDAVEKTSTQRRWAPGPPVEQPWRTAKKRQWP